VDDTPTHLMAERLDQIFRLLSLAITRDMKQREKIRFLASLGLQPKEIASLIGTSPNTVRVELVSIRKNMPGRGHRRRAQK
jgi:DNA-binding CsgD family transcriptional regulator